MSRCRAKNCRDASVVVMQVSRKPRSLCRVHAQAVLDGEKIELKPYRQPGLEPKPQPFVLDRKKDDSGISGTGIVAEGVEFTDGTVVMRWITETNSTSFFETMADLRKIHGHRGTTTIRWLQDT